MGTESKERDAVMNAYPGKSWQDKVKRMSDSQIVALYLKFKAQGRIT